MKPDKRAKAVAAAEAVAHLIFAMGDTAASDKFLQEAVSKLSDALLELGTHDEAGK